MRYEVYTVLMRLPPTVKAFTVTNPDGSYTTFVNDLLSREAQKEACDHELEHIEDGDFDSLLPADVIERFAHGV